MTSIASATEELERFLADTERRVLVCQGPWGIGKTFFWKQFIASHLKSIQESAYSYVSLFGASDTGQLKNRIIANAHEKSDSENGNGSAVPNSKYVWARLAEKFSRLTQGIDLPVLKQGNELLTNVLSNAQEFLIRDCLVCFDDLERKLPGLSMVEFLGLVSALRDENGCRIVLIFNDGALNTDDKSDFEKYREKVIDSVFTYRPSIRDNVRLAFAEQDVDTAVQIFAGASLNNIRVMQQCVWALGYFDRHIGGVQEEVKTGFRKQIIKITLLHYAFADQVKLEEISGTSWMFLSMLRENKPSYAKLLESIEFNSDELDKYVVDYLRNGYCNMEEFTQDLVECDKKLTAQTSGVELERIYSLLNENFLASPTEVSEQSASMLEQHCMALSWKEVVQLTDFLVKVDPDRDWGNYAQRAMREAIGRANERSITELKGASRWPEITQAIADREHELAAKLGIDELIYRLAGTDGWTPSDFARLDGFSVEELVTYVEQSRRADLLRVLRELIRRAAADQGEPAAPRILEKLRTALASVAQRNVLDEWRVHHIMND
jgi:hypothetical protein